MYKCMSIIFWDRILRHKSFLWWVSLYMIKKKTSNKVPCVWFPRQNLFCAKLVSRHFLFITCIYHFIVLFLIHFLFKCLPLLHIFYSIIYPLHVSHTFCIQSSTTIVPVTPHTIFISLSIIHYSSSCSSTVLSVEELSLSVCMSVSSGFLIRSAYTALGSHIQCLWNDRGVLASKKSAL